MEIPTTSVQVLKIAKPVENTYYYLEYRRAIGFDTNLTDISKSAGADFYEGILIHTWNGKTPAVTNLVTKYIGTDFILEKATFCDSNNKIHIQQLGRDATKAVVKITFEPCQSVSVTPPPPAAIPSITPPQSCPINSITPTSFLVSSPTGTKLISATPSVIDKNNGKLRRGNNWPNWLLHLLLLLILLLSIDRYLINAKPR